MRKRAVNTFISIVLVFALISATCTNVFAATYTGNTYIKETVISYGKTADEAKAWLTGKGYTVLDYNLNEGADDTWSTERAVYLGYKTTKNAEEAITDMKLMNMKGGYSVEDYQMLLEEQKSNIRVFISNFITAIGEYRKNYTAGQQRALAAHEMLNLLYDDDTELNLGDLLLNKIKEEYSDEEWKALSAEEQSQAADMTTILMQSNSASVLAMEQLIALAADSSNTLWTERYVNAKTYDEMISSLMKSEKLTVSQAVKKLAAEYDEDAKLIASKLDGLKDYINTYTNEKIRLTDSAETVKAYQENNEKFNVAAWAAAGAQYEVLSSLENDDVTLLDMLTGDDYDVSGDDRYMLYPLVSVLTAGQRACLDFLPMYQIIAVGINDDAAVKKAMENVDIKSLGGKAVSIYNGIDRSIFSSQVALTSDAYRLQNSADTNAASNWFDDGVSASAKVMFIALGVTVATSVASLIAGYSFAKSSLNASKMAANIESMMYKVSDDKLAEGVAAFTDLADDAADLDYLDDVVDTVNSKDPVMGGQMKTMSAIGSKNMWSKIFTYTGIAMVAISIVLMGVSLWKAYSDLKEYYNVELTPIPMHMVNQGVDDGGKKTFTYYTAANCNREEAQMVADNTKILKGYGDLNGDVGRQWVALYTTKDKAAGDPIMADGIKVQFNNSSLPGDSYTALSMFGESVAQNLTNKSAGYTYADDKNGIYLFYNTDSNAFTGSIFSNKTYVLIGGSVMAVFAVISFFVSDAVRKKKSRKEESANA